MQEARLSKPVELPERQPSTWRPVEHLLARRRSVREFANEALSLGELGRLLWAAQGITDEAGLRTAPSAGALYPLELMLVAGRVEGLSASIYRYRPHAHSLESVAKGDVRRSLARAAFNQNWMAGAPAILAFSAVMDRTVVKYGPRAFQYVCMEVGHCAQNVYLEAQSLGLATVMVGAFDDVDVRAVLRLTADETPLALMPLGQSSGGPAGQRL